MDAWIEHDDGRLTHQEHGVHAEVLPTTMHVSDGGKLPAFRVVVRSVSTSGPLSALRPATLTGWPDARVRSRFADKEIAAQLRELADRMDGGAETLTLCWLCTDALPARGSTLCEPCQTRLRRPPQ